MRTFIVRVQEHTAAADRPDGSPGRLRGFVDEVASGLRATFRDEHELVTALVTALEYQDESASSANPTRWQSRGDPPCHEPES